MAGYRGASGASSPAGPAGGDLSGTYPDPGVAKVAGVTPSAFALTVLDDTTAAAARTTLGALGGALGSTDNSLLRADGTGGATAQGTSIATLGDDSQLDIGSRRVMPVVNTTWTTGVAVTVDLGTLQNGDYIVTCDYWIERITGGATRVGKQERFLLRRAAGTLNLTNNGSVGSIGSFGPSIVWGVSGDDLTVTITSAASDGRIGYQTVIMYVGVLNA